MRLLFITPLLGLVAMCISCTAEDMAQMPKTTLSEKGTEFTVSQSHANLSKNFGHKHITQAAIDHHGDRYGIHGEISRIHFNERAIELRGGFSFGMTDRISSKILVGSSTYNRNISPSKMGSFSLEAHLFNRKVMMIPLIERKIYRNGVKTYLMALDTVYYSDGNDEGHYWATQLHVKNTSPTLTRLRSTGVGVGTSFINPKKYTAELYGEVGSTYYENLNTPQRDYSYFLIRPSFDIHLKDHWELLGMATFEHTKFYNQKEFRLSLKYQIPENP